MSIAFVRAQAFEDSGFTIIARVVGNAGTNITQASLSTITYSVYDTSTGTVVTGHNAVALTISTVVFDTLQTDAVWTFDATGYNYKHTVEATALPTGGTVYIYEAKVTPVSGPVFWIIPGTITAHPIYTS